MPLAPYVPEEIIPLVIEELCLLLFISRLLDCQVLSLERTGASCG